MSTFSPPTSSCNSPQLYATFLLWLMSELFEELPEVGDPEKPRLVFFFDEAHLLFNDAPPGLLQKIEQVVRLIRSKGVGIYFVTQNPLDMPDTVLAQLGNRVQHALRAYTPRNRRRCKAAAQTFRQNPAFKTEEAITELGVGEALVSVLDEKGVPTMVERTLIRPPSGKLGPIDPAARQTAIHNSPIYGEYDKAIDRESAYEILQKRAAEQQVTAQAEAKRKADEEEQRKAAKASTSSRRSDSILERTVKNFASSAARQLGSALIRGILGGLSRR